MKEFQYKNSMQVPRLNKIVVNCAVKEAVANPKVLDSTLEEIMAITGQKPVMTRARKAIAAFKVRKGNAVGVMVTLRRARMYEFLDRLMNVALPRVRDFKGVNTKAFDGRGNYSLGIREQIFSRKSITTRSTRSKDDRHDRNHGQDERTCSRALYELGMPFRSKKGDRLCLKSANSKRLKKKPKFKVRHRNRCPLCGRPRAYMRKFNMCRLCFRGLALKGQLPGVTKSSW